jgi:DNA-binding response OmpR family regulator
MLVPRAPVLVAHPSRRVCEEIAFHLRVAGMAPAAETTGLGAIERFDERPPDLVITGLDLDADSTWTLIDRAASAPGSIPVIVVADAPSLDHVLRLGRLGCRRIVSIRENLRALIREAAEALAGKGSLPPAEKGDGECCGLTVDPRGMSVSLDGRPIELTPLEYKLLLVLMEERDAALSRAEIFRRVWGGELTARNRSIDVLVKRLRQRLEPPGSCCSYLQTAYRVGYRFSPRPRAHA